MNRCKIARENAGLTLGQAAHLLGWERGLLWSMEGGPVTESELAAMADLYHVNATWLRGDGPPHDYATIDAMRGSEHLSTHDRDVLAEFAASLPRKDT